MIKSITFSYRGITWDIQPRQRITLLGGDSATGKSFMCEAIDAVGANRKDSKNPLKDKLGFDNYIHLNAYSQPLQIKLAADTTNSLVIVDYVEYLLREFPTLQNAINSNAGNMYILLGREAPGVALLPGSLAELKFDKEARKFQLHFTEFWI